MADFALGQFIVDIAKLLSEELGRWGSSRKDAANRTVTYIDDIGRSLEAYISALDGDDESGHEGTRLRYQLDQTLENLAYTLDGLVEDHLLQQMLKTLRQGKVTDGMLIPALGFPKHQLRKLSAAERAVAIQGLNRAAGEFRSIAKSLSVRTGANLPGLPNK